MLSRCRALFCASISLASLSAQAALPLTVEDLITEKGKVKLEASLVYANNDRQGVSAGEPITIQTGPTSFVNLPTVVGESHTNSDSLVGTIGLHYGVTGKVEIYARGSFLHNSSRINGVLGTSNTNENRFADAWAGVNYQFKKDDETPALLGFAEIALSEKHRESTSSLKSAAFGLTTYKAIDPVVFSLTTAYRINQSRKDGEIDYQPGNSLTINPSVGFAVNDKVTLTTGLQWSGRQPDRVDGLDMGFFRTSTDLMLGVGYGIDKGNTLNFTFNANASGRSGADLRFNWLRTL